MTATPYGYVTGDRALIQTNVSYAADFLRTSPTEFGQTLPFEAHIRGQLNVAFLEEGESRQRLRFLEG